MWTDGSGGAVYSCAAFLFGLAAVVVDVEVEVVYINETTRERCFFCLIIVIDANVAQRCLVVHRVSGNVNVKVALPTTLSIASPVSFVCSDKSARIMFVITTLTVRSNVVQFYVEGEGGCTPRLG